MKNSNPPRHRTSPRRTFRWGLASLRICLSLLFLGFSGCSDPPEREAALSAAEIEAEQIKRMVESEELVLKLTPLLRALGQAMVSGSRSDLPEAVAGEASIAPWQELDPSHRWQNASFGTLSANFEDSAFVMKTKFEGVRRGKDGAIVGVKAKQMLFWERGEGDRWGLAKWKSLNFETDVAKEPLFQEVLDTVLPDSIAREKARHAYHEEVMSKTYSGQTIMVGRYKVHSPYDIESLYQYPTVSVVDYDGDGHEDLFLSSRWLSSQLLRNRGDNTFEDVTGRSGLAVEHYVNFALFADFDNDGDPDALLGRTQDATLYYRNDGGVFTDVTESLSNLGRQLFVSSASVADVNRDGLLDVYLSTYNPGLNRTPPDFHKRYFNPAQLTKLKRLESTSHPHLDHPGIANVLLMNRGGGRLERAGGETVNLWRKSYQPLWFDADGDGDDDLYVCNDFAPDSFLRNDTPRGGAEPVFADAFKETFPEEQLAFGMGATAGDYDNDGDLDLYISNMYSKAGNRILARMGDVDPRFEVAARGNFLYRNDGGVFHQVAEADAPETKVGWAFGGQFADFNNDGWLDLYVPSGFYTAPKAIATEVDL